MGTSEDMTSHLSTESIGCWVLDGVGGVRGVGSQGASPARAASPTSPTTVFVFRLQIFSIFPENRFSGKLLMELAIN